MGLLGTLPPGEAILPFAADPRLIPPATQYRSTWLVASLQSLRSHAHFETYLRALRAIERAQGSALEEPLLSCVAGQWLPMAVAQLHYEACNQLALSEDQVLNMAVAGDGAEVRKTWHAQFISAAQRDGATPWLVLKQLNKLWERTAKGGAAAVYRHGPTQALVSYVGCSLFDVRHFRHATRAVLHVLGQHIAEGLRVTTQAGQAAGSAAFLLHWT